MQGGSQASEDQVARGKKVVAMGVGGDWRGEEGSDDWWKVR